MQLIWYPSVADERYIAECAWERAVLDKCPFHAGGGCGAAGHGSYARVHPAGVRIPRFRCPLKGETISLLPAFMASRLSATLDEIESTLDIVENAPSVAAGAELARPSDAPHAVTSISATRWVRRRLLPIQKALLALVTLLPLLMGCRPTLEAIRVRLGVTRVLVVLRELGAVHLHALLPPLGLCTRGTR